jgi:hypothetical protein
MRHEPHLTTRCSSEHQSQIKPVRNESAAACGSKASTPANQDPLVNLLTSPALYPLRIDFNRKVIRFVRMTREDYRDSVFLDLRTQHSGPTVDIRIDDLLLAARSAPANNNRVHYILNTAYCCSTLLARYFELLPSYFVLKEPRLLAQLALAEDVSRPLWDDVLGLCLRLLARTYNSGQTVVIKPNDWCNVLGGQLLDHNDRATLTFLMTPLRQFLLSILKSEDRRDWVRTRVRVEVKKPAAKFERTDLARLTLPEAAAYLWLTNQRLWNELSSARGSRVMVLSGDALVTSPTQSLAAIAETCGLPLDEHQVKWMTTHPLMSRHSKDLSRPYDSMSRQHSMADLERCWGAEADVGVAWAARFMCTVQQ